MSELAFVVLMVGVGLGIGFCCFCSYCVSKCLFKIKIDKPSELPITEIKIIENPMHNTEDPINN
jgi:hypothetical protein